MKAYLFNIDSGVYSGEDFFEPGEIAESEGVTALPPPDARPGAVPVFDPLSRSWQLVPIDTIRTMEMRHE